MIIPEMQISNSPRLSRALILALPLFAIAKEIQSFQRDGNRQGLVIFKTDITQHHFVFYMGYPGPVIPGHSNLRVLEQKFKHSNSSI